MTKLKWTGSLEAQKQYEEARSKLKPRTKKRKKTKNKKVESPLKVYHGSYKKYLLGSWWKKKRVDKLRSIGWKCERCFATKKLEVHHRHYKTLGREKNRDLEVLCGKCHDIEHEALIQCDSHLRSISGQLSLI